jgi:hypothetical protein
MQKKKLKVKTGQYFAGACSKAYTVGPIQTRQKKKKTTTTLIDINRIN